MLSQRLQKDSIKLFVNLINRIKSGQGIDIKNKLLSIQISSLPSQLLKILIEVEMCNGRPFQFQKYQEQENKIQRYSKTIDERNEERTICRLLILKMKSFTLLGLLQDRQSQPANLCVNKLVLFIKSWEQFQFVIKIVFRTNSLVKLQSIDPQQVKIGTLSELQKQNLFFMLAIVKICHNPESAKQIFKSKLKNKYNFDDTIKQKTILLSILRVLIKKQKQLINDKKYSRIQCLNSSLDNHSSTKSIIKNRFISEYMINIGGEKKHGFNLVTNLQEKKYLEAAPLYHLYHEKNPEVLDKIADSNLYRNISTSKSFIVSSLPLNSQSKYYQNRQSQVRQKSKYKKDQSRYADYLYESDEFNRKKCMGVCRQGIQLMKYNYNNSENSVKWVKFNEDALYWGKNKETIESSNTNQNQGNSWGYLWKGIYKTSIDHRYLTDRTADFSLQKDADPQRMLQFILGASRIIDQYHSHQRTKLQKELEGNEDESENEHMNQLITYHTFKRQTMTKGRLLWRNLFLTIGTKNPKNDGELFPKVKNLLCLSPRGKSRLSNEMSNKSSFQ